jgi:hypothetical protein
LSPARAVSGLLLLCGLAGNGVAQVPGAAQWWIGFVDTRNHAFLELPVSREACAAREAAFKRAPQAAGTVLAGALKPDAFVPPGARLLFGVSDLRGRYVERVLPRVAAIARDDEHQQGACWYFAEAGTEAPGYVAEEDTLAIATLPPRRLGLRIAADDWRAYGSAVPVDGRFAAMENAPAAWRKQVEKLLPAYTEVYGQSFSAVLEKGAAPQNLSLVGAIDDGKGEAYNTLNLILRAGSESAGAAPLYLAGPSGGVAVSRAGSFVTQAVAAVDLDGDGVDEVILRARYFSGGNLKVLKLVNGLLVEIRQSAYEGE